MRQFLLLVGLGLGLLWSGLARSAPGHLDRDRCDIAMFGVGIIGPLVVAQ